MNKTIWSTEKPIREGTFWFYGDPYTSNPKEGFKNKLYVVEVWRGQNKSLTFVCGNAFMYKDNCNNGLWANIDFSILPRKPRFEDKKY